MNGGERAAVYVLLALAAYTLGYQQGSGNGREEERDRSAKEPRYTVTASGVLIVRTETKSGDTQMLNLATKKWMDVGDSTRAALDEVTAQAIRQSLASPSSTP